MSIIIINKICIKWNTYYNIRDKIFAKEDTIKIVDIVDLKGVGVDIIVVR